MTDSVLKAQMQLFAIVARLDNYDNEAQEQIKTSQLLRIIKDFISSDVADTQIEPYLETFKEYFQLLGKRRKFFEIEEQNNVKRSSLNSVKALRICEELNKELTFRQKYYVYIRICELLALQEHNTGSTLDFLQTLSESFHLDKEDTNLIQKLVLYPFDESDIPPHVLVAKSQKVNNPNYLNVKGINGKVIIAYIHSVNIIFVRYIGTDVFIINGNTYDGKKVFLLQSGSFIQCGPSNKIYQSDLLNRFIQQTNRGKFVFDAQNISWKSKQTNTTIIQPITTSFKAGRLVGIIGFSGSGKTTLIEILNGSIKPTTGSVEINGVDVHSNLSALEGIIGYVPQSDQLSDQLTVYENLYFTAKLCYANATNGQLKVKVHRVLQTFGLYDIKDLKVGDSMDKVISGGQRKRLNIALELIQNPDILFIDEPTSGLSSKGSLEIMSHLKELTFSGKLVFVVIHQPSSDVFKLFNRIMILDKGGYLTFDGKPIDALNYFKSAANQVGKHVEECPTCYNVDPDALFEIIDARTLDNSGNQTNERKVQPSEWNHRFKKQRAKVNYVVEELPPLTKKINKPSRWKQFQTFFLRDGLSKLKNRQFMLMMLLQAPLLGFFLSIFLKEFSGNKTEVYTFFSNSNIPSFLFVSVLVAIFFGTTMSAEEIFKDRKILKRQRYLHLSWNSYLIAKIVILVLISGIQSLLYTLVSSLVIGLYPSFLPYWILLFSLTIWANILGLSISILFNSTKVIYITIPIIIIPQIIFSGLMVSYDRMHPWIRTEHEVPWIGNLMASRWAFEALTVELATNNPLEKEFYPIKKQRSLASWKSEFWIPQMELLLDDKKNDEIVKNELIKENKLWKNVKCEDCITSTGQLDKQNTTLHLQKLQKAYNKTYQYWNNAFDELLNQYGKEKYYTATQRYCNEELLHLASNKYALNKIFVDTVDQEIVQLSDPLYQKHTDRMLDAPMYIKSKTIAGIQVDTYWLNTIIIWSFTFLLYLLLALQITSKLGRKIQNHLKTFELKRTERRKEMNQRA